MQMLVILNNPRAEPSAVMTPCPLVFAPERMLKRLLAGKGQVLLCGTFMNSRRLTDSEPMEGARRSTIDELAAGR
jgi:hypothetical protein